MKNKTIPIALRLALLFVIGATLSAVVAGSVGLRLSDSVSRQRLAEQAQAKADISKLKMEASLTAAFDAFGHALASNSPGDRLQAAGYAAASVIASDQTNTPIVAQGIANEDWHTLLNSGRNESDTPSVALSNGQVLIAAPMAHDLPFGAPTLAASLPLSTLEDTAAGTQGIRLQDAKGDTLATFGPQIMKVSEDTIKATATLRIADRLVTVMATAPSQPALSPGILLATPSILAAVGLVTCILVLGALLTVWSLAPLKRLRAQIDTLATTLAPDIHRKGTNTGSIDALSTMIEALQNETTTARAQHMRDQGCDQLLELGSQALALIDQEQKVIASSQAFAAQLGKINTTEGNDQLPSKAEDLVGVKIGTLIPGWERMEEIDEEPESDSRLSRLAVNGRQLEIRIRKADSLASADSVSTVELRDVTEECVTRGLVDAIEEHSATVRFDLEGCIVDANDNFLKTMGYEHDEIIGMHHSSLVPPDEQSGADYLGFWDGLRSGKQIAGKFRRLAKDGREIWLEAAYNPIRDAEGVPYTVIKYATDVTQVESLSFDRKSVLDSIGMALAVFETDIEGRIKTANSNFSSLINRRSEDLIGEYLTDLFPSDFLTSEERNELFQNLQRGRSDARTYQFRSASGHPLYLRGTLTPVFGRDNHVFKIISCLSDVTEPELERLDQERRNQEMTKMQAHVVSAMGEGLKQLANGDLSVQIDERFDASYDQLRIDFNKACNRLERTISTLANNADGIKGEAGEIARAADDLSRRTENQAATLEQTSASLEQLTASVKSAADGAAKVSQNVSEAQANAERSGGVVDNAITAMSAIENSSRQISQIIGVIDDIAFQTNLLALNAGVEAARAGDAGRGFAVVASEVRALAQRSSEAAKEIKSLISTSSEQVGSGVELVGQTGTALRDILGSITSIAALVEDIANTAREQSVGIGEINTAVNQIDQVTQQNAAMVEKSTTASHSMTQEAAALAELVGQFKTTKREASKAHPAPVAPRPAAPRSIPTPVAKPVLPAKKPDIVVSNSDGNAALKVLHDDDVAEWDEF